jgi:hypothetical protein
VVLEAPADLFGPVVGIGSADLEDRRSDVRGNGPGATPRSAVPILERGRTVVLEAIELFVARLAADPEAAAGLGEALQTQPFPSRSLNSVAMISTLLRRTASGRCRFLRLGLTAATRAPVPCAATVLGPLAGLMIAGCATATPADPLPATSALSQLGRKRVVFSKCCRALRRPRPLGANRPRVGSRVDRRVGPTCGWSKPPTSGRWRDVARPSGSSVRRLGWPAERGR